MVPITATNSATSTVQSMLGKARLEQARREADRAEASAQNLRSQAQEVSKANDGQNKVRSIGQRISQQDGTYTSAIKGRPSEVPAQTQDFLERLYRATSQKFTASGNSLKTNADALPVVNAQGQSTGRIVNVSA